MFELKKQQRQIILKPSVSFGQCTCGDWSQMNGATQIALGYANGFVALFKLNSKSLDVSSLTSSESAGPLEVLPFRLIQAHFTALKTLKWCKNASSVFVTNSLFSREIKLWNGSVAIDDSPVLAHEVSE